MPPARQPDQISRTHEYLTRDEVERTVTAARQAGGRLAERAPLLIMMVWRHRFQASELTALFNKRVVLIATAQAQKAADYVLNHESTVD